MSDLSTNIFETIDSLVSRRIDSTPIDTTITGEITLLRNVDIGEYKVTYQGNTFSAFSLDPMTVYKQGEEVYVLVPKGDFSSKKIILGKAAFNDKVSYADRQAMSNQWRTRGPNWLSSEWYWRNSDGGFRTDAREAYIVATNQADDASIVHPIANWRDYAFYRDGMPDAKEQNYTATRQAKTKLPAQRPGNTAGGQAALERIDHEFQLWGGQMDYIMVKANFETAFLSSHSTGEYGVWVECYVDNPKYGLTGYDNEPQYNLMSFKLGFGDFNGARYSFTQPTPQYAVFPVPRGVLKGLVRVSLFQTDGWTTDIQPVSVNPTNPTVEDPNGKSFTFEVPPAKLVLDRNNISATNLEIYWCEPVNLSDRLFWIKLDTIKGTSLFNTPGSEASWITSLPMQAHLMYGGEDITSKETCKFVWFRQKYSALRDLAEGTEVDTFGNTWAGYLPEGENGWAPISQMIKSPAEDPALGENATYQLGTMNNTTFVPDANFQDALLVPIAEVPWQWKYMVVCYYNPTGGSLEEVQRSKQNDALIWDTQTIRNISSIHDFELPMAMIGDNLSDILLRVRNNTLPWEEGVPYDQFDPSKNDPQRDWYCRWWWSAGQSYNAMQVDGDPDQQRYHKGRRRIDQLLLNEPITFKAQVYGKRNPTGSTAQQMVGDAAQVWPDPPSGGVPDMQADGAYNQYELANVERAIIPDNSAAVHVEFIGQRTHNYNANGKIRLAEMADRQYNIRAKITPRDESIVVFGVEWLAPDRTPLKSLSADQVIAGAGYTPSPQNSMLKDMWMSVPNNANDQRSLHYKVSDTYDIDKVTTAENTFILQIRFLNGVVQEVPCEINYQKADSNGSQGSEWTAQIWPCNATMTLDGMNAVGYTPWTRMIQEHPRPLVVNGDWNPTTAPTSGYSRNDDYKLFLRPFIRRNGEALESLNEASNYTYKVFWDVRYPIVKAETSPRADASNGSFLEFSQASVSGRANTDLGRDGSLATGTPYQKGPTLPAGLDNLQAYSHSLDREGNPYQGVPNGTAQPTYGAIQVQWANRSNVGGRSFKELNYSFVVKARIEIYYNGVGVASITSFHGVDIVFTNGMTLNTNNFKPSMVKTNWPKDIMYTSSGMAPTLANQALSFLYGDSQYLAATSEPYPMTATPINLTPHIQELNIDAQGLNTRGPYNPAATYSRTGGDSGKADVVTYEGYFFAVKEIGSLPPGTAPDRLSNNDPNWRQIRDLTSWKLLPRAFYFFEDMDNGALATDVKSNTGKWPNGATSNPDFASWVDATFVRPIVYFISQYGNEHVNGWDGKSIDLDDKNGTIFAPTIGAGWKHPFTNTFSGVIMGIDTSQLKAHYDSDYGGFSDDNISQNKYMTGLYGYQDGHNSFGIMENGTAFFGRADRGGRIIIDGYNAQIYGGTAMEHRIGLDADMRNRMRLSFIDFGGIANEMDFDDPNLVSQSYSFNTLANNYNTYVESINWNSYHRNATYKETVDLQLETYKNAMNTLNNNPTPGMPIGDAGGIVLGSFPIDQPLDPGPSPSRNQWFGDFHYYFAPGWGSAPLSPGINPYAARYGGYFTGSSYSTPAIEIGSYEEWMKTSGGSRRPYTPDEKLWVRDDYQYHRGLDLIRHYTIKHIQQGSTFNNITTLEIPGFRRFLVTYDGTLYAMNAFIKGNIIGSNIIGSQFFNGEGTFAVTEDGNMGIGKGYGDWTEESVVNGYASKWSNMVPEVFERYMWTYLPLEGNQRQDFLDGGFGFYVSNTGIVICKEIHIAGGSINIGDFHVIGKTDSDLYKGDVVSYGTMYLVGRKGSLPGLGVRAIEAWGDIYARGRLANLGPVLFGGSWEKRVNPTSAVGTTNDVFPTSFNSPFSIIPSSGSAGSAPSSEPNYPVKLGLWPLYFQVGTGGVQPNADSNNTWVTMSTSPTVTGQDNGYMPSFSLRPASQMINGFIATLDGGKAQLGPQVLWRLDQLGMWSDGIILTSKDPIYGVAGITDTSPLNFNSHGLGYFGWWTQETYAKSQLRIENVNGKAPSFAIETLSHIRISAGKNQTVLRNGPLATTDDYNTFLLDIWDPGSDGTQRMHRGAALMMASKRGAATDGAASAILANSSVIGLEAFREKSSSENGDGLQAFLHLGGIGPSTWSLQDEMGRDIGRIPQYSLSKPGRIWMKGIGIAIDGAADLADIQNTNLNTTVRLNRSWDGSDTSPGMPTDQLNGTNFLGLASGTIMLRSVTGAAGANGSIHIIAGPGGVTDNTAGANEIYLANTGGLIRATAVTELSIGLAAGGHGRPSRGLVMTASEFRVLTYTAEQQFGIYARFA